VTARESLGETTSDRLLLARIGKKDEEALSALYDRYGGLVFSEAKRILRDAGAAEEILQDLFYQVWRRSERFAAATGSLAGWLLIAARNQAIAKLLRKSDGGELDESGVALKMDVKSHTTQKLLVEKVRAVMGRLPESQRHALEYAYFEGMSCLEIARKMGRPPETVKVAIRNAMEELQKGLS